MLPLRCSDVMSECRFDPTQSDRDLILGKHIPDPRNRPRLSTRDNIHRMSSAEKTRAVGASLGIHKPAPISQLVVVGRNGRR